MTKPRIVTIATGNTSWWVHVYVGADTLHFPAGRVGYKAPAEARRLIDHLQRNADRYGWEKALALGEHDPPPTAAAVDAPPPTESPEQPPVEPPVTIEGPPIVSCETCRT
jgi:hypothetical protein